MSSTAMRIALKLIKCLRVGLFSFAVLLAGASTGIAQRAEVGPRPPEQHSEGTKAAASGVLSLLPGADAVSEHVLEAGGQKLAYTATAGTFSLYDGNGERSAMVYYTA